MVAPEGLFGEVELSVVEVLKRGSLLLASSGNEAIGFVAGEFLGGAVRTGGVGEY